MIILYFVLSLFYLWTFIDIVFGNLVLSTSNQAISVFMLFLAFLAVAVQHLENKKK